MSAALQTASGRQRNVAGAPRLAALAPGGDGPSSTDRQRSERSRAGGAVIDSSPAVALRVDADDHGGGRTGARLRCALRAIPARDVPRHFVVNALSASSRPPGIAAPLQKASEAASRNTEES